MFPNQAQIVQMVSLERALRPITYEHQKIIAYFDSLNLLYDMRDNNLELRCVT